MPQVLCASAGHAQAPLAPVHRSDGTWIGSKHHPSESPSSNAVSGSSKGRGALGKHAPPVAGAGQAMPWPVDMFAPLRQGDIPPPPRSSRPGRPQVPQSWRQSRPKRPGSRRGFGQVLRPHLSPAPGNLKTRSALLAPHDLAEPFQRGMGMVDVVAIGRIHRVEPVTGRLKGHAKMHRAGLTA